MIKVLKLQKAIYVVILGIVGLITFKVMEASNSAASIWALKFSGLLLLIGALWFLYPILFARKVNEEEVQLDPEKQPEAAAPAASTNRP
jgi:predicted membrane channel-forming protein YqfA (hemolysin III family)